jgi:hypothetical protein
MIGVLVLRLLLLLELRGIEGLLICSCRGGVAGEYESSISSFDGDLMNAL